jgi:hypothetical protein
MSKVPSYSHPLDSRDDLSVKWNKKAKRVIDLDWTHGADQVSAALITYEDINDRDSFDLVRLTNASEAHQWLRCRDMEGRPEIPSVDDMLEAISIKLQDDCRRIMEYCSENEGWLRDLYQRSKEKRLSVTPPQR